MLLGLGLRLDRAVTHATATGDQVDQRRQERDEDQEEHPGRLPPTGQLVVTEEVTDDRDQDPDPDHEEEDLEGNEEGFSNVDVGKRQGRRPFNC
jgi:hypothetical protein